MYWKVPLETLNVCLNLLSEYDVPTKCHQPPFLIKRRQDLVACTWYCVDSNKIENREACSMTIHLLFSTHNIEHRIRIRFFLFCFKTARMLLLLAQEATSAEIIIWIFGAIFSKSLSKVEWKLYKWAIKRGGVMGFKFDWKSTYETKSQ